jgi:hypothetical protein
MDNPHATLARTDIIPNMAMVTDMAMAKVRPNHRQVNGGNYSDSLENLSKAILV